MIWLPAPLEKQRNEATVFCIPAYNVLRDGMCLFGVSIDSGHQYVILSRICRQE
jgi:hypothetical protein